jgi:hypothetical protein
MPTDLAQLLRHTIDREIPELRALTDENAARAPKPRSWSPKQELGHLIDFAANNHMRFAVASIEARTRAPATRWSISGIATTCSSYIWSSELLKSKCKIAALSGRAPSHYVSLSLTTFAICNTTSIMCFRARL